MTTITIYNPSGASFDASLNKDAKVFRKLGGDYYVELSFNVDKTLDLPKGSYIEISDPTTNIVGKYALKRDASPEPISGATGYKYVLKFYAGQHEMEHCQVKWQAGNLAELSFRLTTSLKGYAKLIADNMNAYLESDIWAYDESLDDADMREQSFEGVSCWDAINSIANAFGVEWWVSHGEKLTIHFGKCENEGDATEIREGEIVNRFPAPKRGDDSNYGTRFYIFGGTQNVPEDYRNSNTTSAEGTTFHISEKRICLQKFDILERPLGYLPYYDVIEGLPSGAIVEKTIICDDIFPKNETIIGHNDIAEVYETIIDGQEPQPVYYIKVANKPTLLSTLGITFTTGALAGRSFGAAIVEKNNTYQIKINHITENSGGSSVIAVPNDNLAPKAGDKYILTGVKLSDDRIKAAEIELWEKGPELARQRANDTNVYDCPTDPVYCHANSINFDLGDKVELKGAHFGETGRKSRIQGYEKLLYAPYVATYNIGDNSVYSRTSRFYKDIKVTVTEAIVAGNKNTTPTKGEKGEPGNYTEYRYRLWDSATSAPPVGNTNREPSFWSTTRPAQKENEYIWQIAAIINGATNELVDAWDSPICITPINGTDGKPGVSISKVEVEYAVIDSNNTFPDNNVAWSEDVPVREAGQYIWSRTKTSYSEGDPTTSVPACISGDKGDTGFAGNFTEYRYAVNSDPLSHPTISASAREPEGWSTSQPPVPTGYYLWMTSAKINGANDSLLSIWNTPIRITPINGAKGSRGPALRGPQNWNDIDDGYQFYSGADGEPFIDVVLYDGNHYLCKVSHIKATSSTPENNSNWQLGDSIDLVATKLLLAEYSVIKNLGVEAIEMPDKDGNIVLQAKDGKVKCDGGTFNNINVEKGTIGAWTLTNEGLKAYGNVKGYSDEIKCDNYSTNGIRLKMGTLLDLPESEKEPEVIGGEEREWAVRSPLIAFDSIPKLFPNLIHKAYGIYINVDAAGYVDKKAIYGAPQNIAIDLEGGCIKGLAMLNYVHNLNKNTSFTITRGYNNIIITGTGGAIRQVGMPKVENHHNGYVIRIKNLATQSVTLKKGGSESCFVDNNGTAKTSIDLASLAAAEFVWVTGLEYLIDDDEYKSAWVRYK